MNPDQIVKQSLGHDDKTKEPVRIQTPSGKTVLMCFVSLVTLAAEIKTL
jgi:hypothetical protein